MTVPLKQEVVSTSAIESVIVRGDLSKLNEGQRTEYYVRLCHSLGLNPLTKPFEYLTLNGKLVLYALRACADQLRKINGINLQIISQDQSDGLLTVHVKAKDKDGREDEDLGVVNLPDTLKGDARANAILKAVTKAKRRVTLSICGLGFLDETEVEDIPANGKQERLGTTSADVIGEPIEYDDKGDPVNNIPRGNPQIERMSKAMARPEYAHLSTELRNAKTLDDLMVWGTDNANRVESLPLDWQEILRGAFRDRMLDLGWTPKDQ